MPFLTVNGVTVPIDTASVNYAQVMADSKSYMGYARKGRVARKRSWACKTPMIDADLAQALGGIIQCRGDVYGFDDLTLFSQKGILGVQSAGGSGAPAFLTNSAAADGSFNPESPTFSGYSIYTGVGRVNRLAANDASFETSNPLTAINGASAAQDGAHYYIGSKSVKVSDSAGGSNRGVQSAALTGFTASTTSTFSVMVYNGLAVPLPMTLAMYTGPGVLIVSTPVTVPVGGWSRIALSFTMPSNGQFRWQLVSAQSGFAGSWWVDAAMLEYASSASPWTAPGASAVGSTTFTTTQWALPFGQTFLAGLPDAPDGEVSVGIWTQLSQMNDSTSRTLFNLRRNGGNPQMNLSCIGNFVSLAVTADNGFLYSLTATLPNQALIDSWHYIVVNLRQAPRKGGNWAELWIDGVLTLNAPAATLYGAEPPNLNRLQVLEQVWGAGAWNGQINEMQLNPYCLPPSVITQLYAAQPSVRPQAPQVLLSGGVVGNQSTACIGSKLTYGPVFGHYSTDPNVGLTPMTVMSFQLDEV